MKKLFLSIILSLAALPFFALGLQHEAFVGDSDGLDTAIVFDKGKIKNLVGVYFETHDTRLYEDHHDSGNPYDPYDSYDSGSKVSAINLGVYYQFTWSPTFTKIGNIGLGMDLPLQIGVCYDNVCMLNFFAGLVPAFKVEFNKFDLLIGYRATLLLREAVEEMPFLKSACTIGIRYNLKKGAAVTSSSSNSSSGKSTPIEAPAGSSESKVNVIPGSDIKTIKN